MAIEDVGVIDQDDGVTVRSIAVDRVGGQDYQIDKLAAGADGTATLITAGESPAAGGLTVAIASDSAFIKAEDAAHSSGDKGIMALTVRANSAAATSGTDGDYQPLITDTNGRLHANVVVASGGIASGAIASGAVASGAVAAGAFAAGSLSSETDIFKAEDAAHSSGDKGVQLLTVRSNTAAATSGTDGDYQPLITDTNGRLHANVVVGSGGIASGAVASGAIASGAIASGAVASGAVASGAFAAGSLSSETNVFKAEDAAHSSGDFGVQALAVRTDTPASRSGTDGDYNPLQTDPLGRLYVNRSVITVVTADVTGSAAAAYAIGDCYGTIMTVTGAAAATGRPCILRWARFADYDDVMGAFDLFVFDASTSTGGDNAAFAPADTQALIDVIRFPGCDDVGGMRFYSLNGLAMYLKTNADANLYMQPVFRTGPTIATTTAGNHRFTFGFEQL